MNAPELAGWIGREFRPAPTLSAPSAKRLYVEVPAEDLVRLVEALRALLPGMRLATSTGIDLREGIGVFHHFAVNGAPLVVTLKALAQKPRPRLPSVAAVHAAAGWIEREIHDFLGVEFEGHPDPRRLLKARELPDWAHPLRRDYDPDRLSTEEDAS